MSNSSWHVCSLIVQFAREHAEAVKQGISSIPDSEIIAVNEEECKYVVLLESDNHDFLYQKMESIHDMDHVLAVSLVYHQQDEQTEDLA